MRIAMTTTSSTLGNAVGTRRKWALCKIRSTIDASLRAVIDTVCAARNKVGADRASRSDALLGLFGLFVVDAAHGVGHQVVGVVREAHHVGTTRFAVARHTLLTTGRARWSNVRATRTLAHRNVVLGARLAVVLETAPMTEASARRAVVTGRQAAHAGLRLALLRLLRLRLLLRLLRRQQRQADARQRHQQMAAMRMRVLLLLLLLVLLLLVLLVRVRVLVVRMLLVLVVRMLMRRRRVRRRALGRRAR
jgi:hypothetical protein